MQRRDGFQDVGKFVPVRRTGGNVKIVGWTVPKEGLQVFPGQDSVLGDQIRMKKNADKQAVLIPADRIAIVHLTGRHHQAVACAEHNALTVNVIIHGSLEDMNPLQIVMPVAERPSVRIAGQPGGSDIEGNSRTIVVNDFRISFHNSCLYHISDLTKIRFL